jgi:serine/threonine-protein kinase
MGVIMGTAAYMSPEQARGKPVDKRADIWSFGVVLYEMLTGQRAFQGEDVSLTLASVMKSDLNVTTLPPDLPANVRTVLRRCLEKDASQRIRDIGDVRLAMEGAFETPVTSSSAPVRPLQIRQRPVLAGILAVALVVITGLAVWAVTGSAPSAPDAVTRFPIELPSAFAPYHSQIAISRDGTHLVYALNNQLYLRDMDQMEAIPIRGTEGALEPFFSPDGQSVGFWVSGQLKKVALTGGASVTIGDVGEPFGVTWGSDDTILFAAISGGVWQVPASGGTPDLIIPLGNEEGLVRPQLLPGDEWVLFSVAPGGQVVLQSLRTGERQVLLA